MTTQAQVRASFWEAHPQFKSEFRTRKKQNEYKTDIGCSFVDHVEHLRTNEEITQALAQRVTL